MADTWTAISGYTPQDYTDTLVFEMSADTKKVEKILGQALVAGEKDSQYISFLMPRYWDGIDISGKTFSIEYALAGTYYGKSEAVNAEMTAEQVRFGWIVPETACAINGTLFFILKVESEDYVLKSQIIDVPVYKTIDIGDVVPEPTKEAWYREFAARAETVIAYAEAAETAAQEAQSAQESVDAASQAAQTAAQTAQVLQEAAEAAAQTASDKASEAQGYAQSAEVARDDALTAQAAAETAQQFAETAQTGAANARAAAETAQTGAEQALTDTMAAIAADSETTTLNITRVISTTYMTDAQFARVVAWKKRNMLFLKFNAEFTGTGYTVSDFTTIARISGWSALSEVLMTIPNQTDGTKLLTLSVKSNGEVQVYSPSAISGFYRGYVCVPYSG